MPYIKQTWVDLPSHETPLSAERLSYIEDGIEAATELAEAIASPIATDVDFTPTGSVSSTNVQAAIMEVVADFNAALSSIDLSSKVSKSGDTMSGPLVIEIAGSSTPLVVRHDSNGEVQVAITQTAIEFDDTAGGGFIVLEKNASDQLTVNGDAVATEDYVDAVGFDGLTDVDPIGKVSGSIFHWDAVDGTYNPSPLNVASDGTTDLVASQATDVLRLHIGSSPAGFSVSASNDGEDTSQQLQVHPTGVFVNGHDVLTRAGGALNDDAEFVLHNSITNVTTTLASTVSVYDVDDGTVGGLTSSSLYLIDNDGSAYLAKNSSNELTVNGASLSTKNNAIAMAIALG